MKLFRTHRKQLIEWIFEHSQSIYTTLFKKHESWGISRKELLTYPTHSFGNHLGNFLNKNGFELIPKVERHDAYHTLTGYGTKVEDEIALQCLCFGNGKRSLYLYGAMILGIIILPDYLNYYNLSYNIGKHANPFHHFDYKQLLHVNIDDFRVMIFPKKQYNTLIFNTNG
ncbi:Coq4 family protein [Psychroserpens sp. AS72]|uniref:Coq4 family protein n=1 Tax=Psychroserpens sp. AS72 TaxID=3135775 RepID=UPI0031700B76